MQHTPSTPGSQHQRAIASLSAPLPSPSHPDLILIGEFCEQRGPIPLHLFSANHVIRDEMDTSIFADIFDAAAPDTHHSTHPHSSRRSGVNIRNSSTSGTSSSFVSHSEYLSHFESLHAEATQHMHHTSSSVPKRTRRQSFQDVEGSAVPRYSTRRLRPQHVKASSSRPATASNHQETASLMYWKPLVTRILSSDHSASVSTFPYTSLSSHFYLTHESYDVYCMLLTFRDLYARGFSRPVCICYISQQDAQSKILSQFYQFTVAFENVAKILQFGNYYQFLRDLSREIAARDLQNLDETTKTEILDDMRDLRRRFESFLNDRQSSLEEPIQDIVCAMTLHEDWSRTALPADFLKLLSKGLQVAPEYLNDLMPNIMDQMHKRKGYETELRRIAQICRSTFSNATTMMCKHILKFFSRSARVLSLEMDDLEIIDEKPLASLLFVGKSLLMDFDLDACQSKRKLKPHLLSATTGRTTSAASVSSFTTANSLPQSGSSWNSIGDPHSVSTGSILETASEASDISSEINDSLSSVDRDEQGVTRGEGTSQSALLVLHSNHGIPSATQSQNSSRSGSSSRLGVSSGFHIHTSRPEKKYYIFKGDFTGSYASSVFPPSSTDSTNPTSPSHKLMVGDSIRDFILTYSFSIHLVFSILMGRLTIITAAPEREDDVRKVVRALSVFLPGQFWDDCCSGSAGSRKSTQPQQSGILQWCTKNVSLKDMQAYRIIGLAKPAIVPLQLRNSVTIMDMEKNCLRAPRYQGRFLKPILVMAPLLVDNESFMAHIHAVLLEIGRQAVVHMHAFTLPNAAPNSPPTLRDLGGVSLSAGSTARLIEKSNAVKKQFADISPSDMDIVEHFIDTICLQQASSLMNHLMPTPIKVKRDPVMDFH